MHITLTAHAEARAQQRGIRSDILEVLISHGHREYDHRHCEIVIFDRKAIERIKRIEGAAAAHLASDHRDIYAVLGDDGAVVTTGHRFRRVLRNKSKADLYARRGRVKHRPV